MAIEIKKNPQQFSVGRRLFSMAAPIVGGAAFGPAGAAVGGMLGGKMAGQSTPDALMGGLKAGAAEGLSSAVAPKAAPAVEGEIVGRGAGGAESAFGRRLDLKSQEPAVAINEGLSVLGSLHPEDPLKQQLAPILIRAQMMGSKR